MSGPQGGERLAVLGRPVFHSLSPRMQTAALRELGLDDWSYEAIELSPEGFAAGVAELREAGYLGVNVTVPHKHAALELADDPSEAARAIGAANTLVFGSAGIAAHNTDAPGLLAALPEDPRGVRALVLGAGGAARAVVWALRGAGAEVDIHNRTRSRAQELADAFDGGVLEGAGSGARLPVGDFGLVVNCTSIGLHPGGRRPGGDGSDLKALGISADQMHDRMVVVDFVYGTEPTELCEAAGRGGAKVVDGIEILVRQGAESLRIWTGMEPPLEAMRRAASNRA